MDFELKNTTEKGAKLVLEKLKQSRLAMLTVGTGGGKTYIAIHAIAQAIPDAHLIIIGPLAKTIDGDWGASVESYNRKMQTHITMEIFNYEKFDNDRTATRKSKTGQRQKASKEKRKSTFYNNLIARIRATDEKLVLIMDEVHRIKHSTGLRASRAITVAQEKNIQGTILLSATPITNSYLDSVSYLMIAGYYKNQSDFNRQHVLFWDDHHQPVVKDKSNQIRRDFFNNPDQIDRELDTFVVNFDVSALKPKTTMTDLRFEFEPDELKEYRQIYKDYRDGKYEHIQAARKEMFDYTNEHAQKKLDALDDILPTTHRPILVFYTYNSALNLLKEHFSQNHPDYDVLQMNGVVSAKKRFSGKTEPKNPKSVVLIQYVAGAEGWNARWSDTTVFYEPTYSYEKFNQSQGRNSRAYMSHEIHHYTFGFNKSLEEAVWQTVKNKKSFSDDLIEKFFDDDLIITNTPSQPIVQKVYDFNLNLTLSINQAKALKQYMDDLGVEINNSTMIEKV